MKSLLLTLSLVFVCACGHGHVAVKPKDIIVDRDARLTDVIACSDNILNQLNVLRTAKRSLIRDGTLVFDRAQSDQFSILLLNTINAANDFKAKTSSFLTYTPDTGAALLRHYHGLAMAWGELALKREMLGEGALPTFNLIAVDMQKILDLVATEGMRKVF